MIAFKVAVTVDTASPALERIRAGLGMDQVLPFFAEVVTQEVQANFMMLDESRPNHMDGERQHYYAGAAEQTSWRQEGGERVVVFSTQIGIAMRYFGTDAYLGGPLMPRNASYLTIPATAEAYGKKAGDFSDLVVLWGKNGPYALGRLIRGTLATMGARAGSAASATEREVVFWLTKEVTQEPDPTLLPSQTRLNAALRIGFNDYVALLWENAANPAETAMGGRN